MREACALCGGEPAGGCERLQTRPPPSLAPQEAAPVEGLRCAAPPRSAPGFLCAGRVSRQGLAVGSAALGLPGIVLVSEVDRPILLLP